MRGWWSVTEKDTRTAAAHTTPSKLTVQWRLPLANKQQTNCIFQNAPSTIWRSFYDGTSEEFSFKSTSAQLATHDKHVPLGGSPESSTVHRWLFQNKYPFERFIQILVTHKRGKDCTHLRYCCAAQPKRFILRVLRSMLLLKVGECKVNIRILGIREETKKMNL